jgi:hypothetical protein
MQWAYPAGKHGRTGTYVKMSVSVAGPDIFAAPPALPADYIAEEAGLRTS